MKTKAIKEKKTSSTKKKTTKRKPRKNLTKKELEKLTPKQAAFVKEYIANGGNGTRAALKSYNSTSENAAAVTSSKLLRNGKVANVIKSYADRFDEDAMFDRHMQLINKNKMITIPIQKDDGDVEMKLVDTGEMDARAVKDGLDMMYKIKGSYSPEKHIVLNLNNDEKRKLQNVN